MCISEDCNKKDFSAYDSQTHEIIGVVQRR